MTNTETTTTHISYTARNIEHDLNMSGDRTYRDLTLFIEDADLDDSKVIDGVEVTGLGCEDLRTAYVEAVYAAWVAAAKALGHGIDDADASTWTAQENDRLGVAAAEQDADDDYTAAEIASERVASAVTDAWDTLTMPTLAQVEA